MRERNCAIALFPLVNGTLKSHDDLMWATGGPLRLSQHRAYIILPDCCALTMVARCDGSAQTTVFRCLIRIHSQSAANLMKRTTVTILKIQMQPRSKKIGRVVNQKSPTNMVKKLLFECPDRCINSYLVGVRAKTASDLVEVALFMDSVRIQSFIEHGQLFLTKSCMRPSCLTQKEQQILDNAIYISHLQIVGIPSVKISHNPTDRMGPAIRLAFRCV